VGGGVGVENTLGVASHHRQNRRGRQKEACGWQLPKPSYSFLSPVLSPDPAPTSRPDPDALRAARRYAALQPSIVDKSPFFDAMVRMVEAAGSPPERIVELGIGTGGFVEAAARRRTWPAAECVGCDLSAARIAVAREMLENLGAGAQLRAGVNALDAADPFYDDVVPPGSADVVVLSQFEHYAPNDDGSALAGWLRQAGRRYCPKAALRRLARSRLRPGGWLFVIDDYGAGTPAEQDVWSRAWDAHVVRELSQPEVLQAVARFDPKWAATLARSYDASRPWEERLALAARARERRRHRDGEETQSLVAARADFAALFADGDHGMVPHPQTTTHPQFFLHWGRVPQA
jgi:SAM-dependent methyltransferase